ncbi:MAG TPA: hypothetical protein VK501_02725 [Baekduia sp.]|uniref:hypothetical protein n=1 Tax=Baekduia sp. TaxID=2600305 RepID=UPI002C8D1B78|nr:hypothetical protein [Baekduia sp.]HMJ32806.1 hypothetical protein [Baekduia sp.]
MADDDLTAFADALVNVQAAFAEAARERLALIRALAAVEVSPGATAAQQQLVAALLRREAADADDAAAPADRIRRSVAEARAAQVARERLVAETEVQELAGAIDATWRAALHRSDALAGWLRERTPPAVAAAFAGYVEALRGLHALGATPSEAEIAAATEAFAGAVQRLERAAGPPPA